MSVQLPPKPSLEQLKKQAKALLKAHRSGEPDACTRIKASFPRSSGAPESEIPGAAFSLRDAQLVIAREYGFESWPKLKRYVETLSEDLHRLLVMRVAHLVSEHLEDAARVIRGLEDDPEKMAILVKALDGEVLSKLGMEKDAVSKMEGTEQERDVLEEFERLLVARKYVSRGGVGYARGALEKVMGPIAHEILLDRVSQLISERPEDAGEVIQSMEAELSKVAILMNALDPETLSRMGKEKGEVSEMGRVTREQEEEVLEEFERLLVTRKYISRGGVEYARGALGPRKAQALLDRVTSAPSS